MSFQIQTKIRSLPAAGEEYFGKRWLNKQMSYMPTNLGPAGNETAVVTGANSSLWFIAKPAGGGWDSMFGGRARLMEVPDLTVIELFLSDGSAKIYHSHDFSVDPNLRGKLKALVNRNGQILSVQYNSDGTPLSASWSGGGRSIAFNYAYHSGTSLVSSVTQVVDGTDVRRVVYTYWNGAESNHGGSAGDLQQVTIQEVHTTGWVDIRKTVYRYYKNDLTNGFIHGLRMIFGPDACRRMALVGVNPITCEDCDLQPYSDHYFEYDSSKRVTVTLKGYEGRITRYSFGAPGSAVPGYLEGVAIAEGSGGSPTTLESYQYGEKSGTGGRSVIAATARIRDLGGGRSAVTSFEYGYFGGGGSGSVPAPTPPSYIANSVTNDTVFLQEESQYDPAGNVILATRSERFHDTFGFGPLGGPNAGGGTPKGRRAYTAIWHDAIGRTRITADDGTNGGAMLVRAADDVAPAGSDIILVTRNTYQDDGDAAGVIDPMGIVTRWENDAMGRRVKLIENCVTSGTHHDQNRTTLYTYHADSQLHTLTILNSVTGDQVTTWHYGTTLGDDSQIASNHLLREKEMADDSTYTFRYNRQGDPIRHIDPNATRHRYDYDPVGRLTADRVTPDSGSDLDESVLAIVRSYTAKGQLHQITSMSLATGGTVVNQVEFQYSPFGQVTQDRQAHDNTVNTGTPTVSYGYADGTANRIHLLSTGYPFNSGSGTREIQFDYGAITGESHRLGRVKGLSISGQGGLASYQYAGLDRTVKLTYVIPEIDLSYISPDGEPGGDAGDPYTGWDRFGRTQDLRWTKGEELLDQTRYGYNRSSQRTWREAPLATSGNDEAYQYDGLYQITGRQRGDLNTNHTAIGAIPVRAEAFNYDPIGNWQNYQVSADGTPLPAQTRIHNKANTLTQIDGSSSLLAHDAAGNMTLCPPPADGDWDKALTLVWDVWNRLTEVRSADGTTLIAKYAYDGLFRRTTRQIGSGPVIHTYYNAQWRPLQETEQTGETTTLTRTYDWGLRYRDDLIRRINHLDEDEVHYALHDYYNVTAIVGSTGGSSSSSESHADGSIAVLERYGYSAFGDVRFMTAAYVTKPASDHAWDLLYKAQFRDIETGFYNYGYRYLSPLLGRWLSRDPIGEEGDLNLYGFVGNNGVNGTDHLGLIKWTTNIKNELINPDTGKIIRNNCLGYALYGKDGIFVTPETDGKEALGPALQRSGWDCTMVKQKSDCSCECSDDKILVAVTQNDNPTNLGKNPFTDKDFDWTEKINGKYVTEFHAIRAITGCSNRYKEVPGANNNIQDQGKVTDPYFDGRYDLLCCCLNKPKD